MLIVLGLVAAGGHFAYGRIYSIFLSNPWLNGLILGVFVLGVLACFWQVVQLVVSVSWIESYVGTQGAGTEGAGAGRRRAPRLLAPLAALLRGQRLGFGLSSGSARSILESVATRIDEARDITRYLSGLLIFLGLLGTFYGLATTVPAVVDTIRALAPAEGETGVEVFGKLMGGLESQLGGMGTAFSSSLLGLAGSLVVGLLDLFASHGQNRFYRELEEWVSANTRLGVAGIEAETPEAGVMAALADEILAQSEATRRVLVDLAWHMQELSGAVVDLRARVESQAGTESEGAQAMEHLARVIEARGAGLGEDAELRMRIRSIDVQLARLLEEIAAGRQESMAELRNDFAALTRAILARSSASREG